MFICFNIIWIKIFYTNNIIKKTCGFLCLYLSRYYSSLNYIINIQTCFNSLFVSWRVISVFVLPDILSHNSKYWQLSKMQWQLIKRQVEHRNFVFLQVILSSLTLLGIVSVSSINSSHVIAETYMWDDSKYYLSHINDVFYIHINIYHYSTSDLS